MPRRKYRYDFHTHTSEASKCGKISGAALAELYASLGFDGFVVTDHFFNGNTTVPAKLPWPERVDLYMSGYESARARGEELGLDVFFGIEANFAATEILTYGVGRDFLLAHPRIDLWNYRAWCDIAREAGAFLSQAHPFRMRDYIPDIRVLIRGEVDAFETINGAHVDDSVDSDRMAVFTAETRGLLATAGSDTHFAERPYFSGMEFDHPIKSDADLVAALRSGEGRIFVINRAGEEVDLYNRTKNTPQ